MAIISLNLSKDIERRSNPLENPSVSLGNLGAVWSWISGTEPTASGEIIDESVALQIVTVYSCVRLIAETASSLPLKLYRKLPKGREEAIENGLYDLLTIEPNPEMSAVPFWEAVLGNLALFGNSYVYVQRAMGKVVGLWPLNPKRTHPVRLPNGDLGYETSEGLANGKTKTYPKEDMLHFKLFSGDGLLGLSPIMLARQSLGLTRAAEKMGARLFANGGRPSGVMSLEGNVNADQRMLLNVRESWQASQTGDNALKTAFLPGNWKYTPLSLNMEDIEFLKTRAFQRNEIAALFHVPGHLVGDTTRQSNSNSEHEALSLVTFTLRPYLYRIESEIKRVLLRGEKGMFVEFDIRELLRGNFKETMDGYAVGRQWGFFNANEIRDGLGDNPIGPLGDIYIVPINYTNAESLLPKPDPDPAMSGPPTPLEPQGDTTEAQGDTTEQPTDPEKPTVPTPSERSVVQRASSLTLVFRDALGRLLHREKRDLATIQGIFEPVVRSMTVMSIQDAGQRLDEEWTNGQETERIIAETIKGIEKRCEKWSGHSAAISTQEADQIAGEEFRKALRAIVSSVYREYGAAIAQEE